MLAGLISRWTIPASWARASPCATWQWRYALTQGAVCLVGFAGGHDLMTIDNHDWNNLCQGIGRFAVFGGAYCAILFGFKHAYPKLWGDQSRRSQER